ncbi:MAG: M48 family metallopeptidase, partial [Gammaproteobacteria bacterium]
MTTLSAKHFDGQTSGSRAVTVKLTVPGYIVMQELGTLSRYRLEDVVIADQIGSQPARIELPDGSMIEIADSEKFYSELKNSSGQGQWVHWLESRWALAVLSLFVTFAFGWMAYVWAIPAGARIVAYELPLEIDDAIGEEGLQILDSRLLAPSELNFQRQLEVLTYFRDVLETLGHGDDYRYRLVFRKGQSLGANALALPAGTIVITDELIRLTVNDEEIAAVLAHEVGHVQNRHALRLLLQNSVVAGLVIALTGDASSATNLAAGIPTLLAQAGYSREFEYEADIVAKEYLT